MKLLDIFCGRGGWTKAFLKRGWHCVGVDIVDLDYPGELLLGDARELDLSFIDSFDAVIASSPCEEFARAWLPWLRFDKTPTPEALELLLFSIKICQAKPRRLAECSKFSARHIAGAQLIGSYAFWGDVPALMPRVTGKEKLSGLNPARRAEIPPALADWIATCFSNNRERV